MSTEDVAWAPDSCTLPTVERPVRVAEFDDLFARWLQRQERLAPTRLRWRFDPEAEPAARDLAGRETSCCSFFGFTFSATEDVLVVDVDMPRTQIAVLDALHARAAAASTGN